MKLIVSASIVFLAVSAKGEVTFTKDVAPILQSRCQVCHRPDTFAPMSLVGGLTFARLMERHL